MTATDATGPERVSTWSSPAPPEDVAMRAAAYADGTATLTLSRGTPGTDTYTELVWPCDDTMLHALAEHFVVPAMARADRRREQADAEHRDLLRRTRIERDAEALGEASRTRAFVLTELTDPQRGNAVTVHRRDCDPANAAGVVELADADVVLARVHRAVALLRGALTGEQIALRVAQVTTGTWAPLRVCETCRPFGQEGVRLDTDAVELANLIDFHPERRLWLAAWGGRMTEAVHEAERRYLDDLPTTPEPAKAFELLHDRGNRGKPITALHRRGCRTAQRKVLASRIAGGVRTEPADLGQVLAAIGTDPAGLTTAAEARSWPGVRVCGTCHPLGLAGTVLLGQADALRAALTQAAGHPDAATLDRFGQWVDRLREALTETQRCHHDTLPLDVLPLGGLPASEDE